MSSNSVESVAGRSCALASAGIKSAQTTNAEAVCDLIASPHWLEFDLLDDPRRAASLQIDSGARFRTEALAVEGVQLVAANECGCRARPADTDFRAGDLDLDAAGVAEVIADGCFL